MTRRPLCWPSFGGESDDLEIFRELRAFYLLIRHSDMAFYMYQRGAIDEKRLRSAIAPVPFSSPLFRDHWDVNKPFFAEDFRDYIDNWIGS